jgi:hypothetical protein
MGQYSQWLHYREAEQLLQTQLELLKIKLAQLQARAHMLQESLQPPEQPIEGQSRLTQNPIIPALALGLFRRTAPDTSSSSSPSARARQANGADGYAAHATSETMSSALFAWSNLPNLGLQEDPLEAALAHSAPPAQAQQSPPSLAQVDFALLPDDMLTFFDEHALTEPQIELPHWLRPIANAASAHHPDVPVDQESIRTNRLVQRWIERWGRQPAPQQPEGENRS